MTTIGFFGGSFDPPHRGHLLLAEWAIKAGSLDRLLVAPVYAHALGKESAASFEHRAEMCALTFSSIPSAEISFIEKELGGVTRTLHTLEALQARYPKARFRLVIGADILEQAHRWYRFDEIASLAPPLVAGREGYTDNGVHTPPLITIDSTTIRARLKASEPLDDLVLPEVERYIREHGLYR